MEIYTSQKTVPYYAVILSSTLLLNDSTYRIMGEKVLELAVCEPGYLGAEWSMGELDILVSYWSSKEAAEAWLSHDMRHKAMSLGENFWYEKYSLKLIEILSDTLFEQPNKSIHTSLFPNIKTERGVLRMLDETQVSLLHDYVNQEKDFLQPWEPQRSEAYYSLETCLLRVREMRRDFLEGNSVTLCFLSQDENRMLAYCNFSNIIHGVFQGCNLGYSLRQNEQGKGFMHEALSAGIEYMHKELLINRIQANYMPRNAKSGAVLDKLGFVIEGKAKDYLKINGVWEDHVLTALMNR